MAPRVGLQCVIVLFSDHTHFIASIHEADCFTVFVLMVSCSCYCSVALPHGVVGWSAVCGCLIS